MEIVIRINLEGLREQLEAARKKKGLSHDALAARLSIKVTGSGVWAILTGKSNAAKLETLLPIADALGIDVREEISEKLGGLLGEKPID